MPAFISAKKLKAVNGSLTTRRTASVLHCLAVFKRTTQLLPYLANKIALT